MTISMTKNSVSLFTNLKTVTLPPALLYLKPARPNQFTFLRAKTKIATSETLGLEARTILRILRSLNPAKIIKPYYTK